MPQKSLHVKSNANSKWFTCGFAACAGAAAITSAVAAIAARTRHRFGLRPRIEDLRSGDGVLGRDASLCRTVLDERWKGTEIRPEPDFQAIFKCELAYPRMSRPTTHRQGLCVSTGGVQWVDQTVAVPLSEPSSSSHPQVRLQVLPRPPLRDATAYSCSAAISTPI